MSHAAKELDMQKSKILGMLFVGCPREVAAHSVGWSEKRLQTEAKHDEQFALDLARHEGGAELHHMKLVHKATEDKRNWRASTWWLDRRSKDRKDRARSRVVTTDDLAEFVEDFSRIVMAQVTCEADRDRLAEALLSAVHEEDFSNFAKLLKQMGVDNPTESKEAKS